VEPLNLILGVIVVAVLYAFITRGNAPKTEANGKASQKARSIPSPATHSNASRSSGSAKREFPYADKTLLFYDPSHGNQIEYFAPDGKCYLWYPGNKRALPGHWRMEGDTICFLFGSNTYNPVTGEIGGNWDKRPFKHFAATVAHTADGDVHGLATGQVPYSLPAHPALESVEAAKRN
jgi:hypothetical protein